MLSHSRLTLTSLMIAACMGATTVVAAAPVAVAQSSAYKEEGAAAAAKDDATNTGKKPSKRQGSSNPQDGVGAQSEKNDLTAGPNVAGSIAAFFGTGLLFFLIISAIAFFLKGGTTRNITPINFLTSLSAAPGSIGMPAGPLPTAQAPAE